jgi:hypothetical protein
MFSITLPQPTLKMASGHINLNQTYHMITFRHYLIATARLVNLTPTRRLEDIGQSAFVSQIEFYPLLGTDGRHEAPCRNVPGQ